MVPPHRMDGLKFIHSVFLSKENYMAKKTKKTKRYNVGGLSVQQIMDIDIDIFNRLSVQELKDITSRLVSAGNKRIRRLEKKNISSPAYRSLGTDNRFSVKLPKGMSESQKVNALRQEFARARNFLSAKTSTIKGYNALQKEIVSEIEEQTGFKLKKGQVSKVYDILHKAQERGDVPINFGGKGSSVGSLQAREIIVNMLNDKNLTEDMFEEKLKTEMARYNENPEEYEYDDETEEFEL